MDILTDLDSRRNRLQLISVIIFFACMALLFGYLLAMRLFIPLPIAVFWIAIVPAFLSLVFQITRVPWRGYEGLLLVEILLLNIALHALYQVPFYGIYDSDSYENMLVVRKIIESGAVMGAKPGENSVIFNPLLDLYGTQLHYLTGIATFNIAKWSPLILSSVFIFLFYITIKKVFKSDKTALLTMLLLVTLQYFIMFSASFKSENIGMVIMMTMLYFLTTAGRINRIEFVSLSCVGLFAIIFAHHLTALILLIFLVAHLVTARISGSFSDNQSSGKSTMIVTTTLALLAFVVVFSYWLYAYQEILVALTRLGYVLMTGNLGIIPSGEEMGILQPETIPTIRGKIIFFGYYFFLAVFGLILLYKIFFKRKIKYTEFYSFTSVLFLCGVLVISRVYFIGVHPVDIPAERLFAWGWVFGFAPLVISILESKSGWSLNAGIVLLAAFMVFNVYTMKEPWDFRDPGRFSGNMVLEEDRALAGTVGLTGEGAAYHKTRLAFYDAQGFFSRDLTSVSSIGNMEALSWIVIKKTEFENHKERGSYQSYIPSSYSIDVINRLDELVVGRDYQGRDKVYESDNLIVFK